MTNTDRSFSAMLNEYLPNDLLKDELIKMDYLLNKVQKDDSWKNGSLIVPFEGARASSIAFGSLTDSSDVSEYSYQRGTISAYVEAWGTLKFQHTDLMQHGKASEQSFLQILPGQVEGFLQYMKEVVSVNMLGAAYFATLTANGDTGGTGYMTVDHPERFTIGQKFVIDDGNSDQDNLYVIAVDMNTSIVTVAETRGGVAFSISAFTTAQSARCYHDGVLVAGTVTNRFTSLRDSMLSSANGGTATLYGKTKATYPYLQSQNISGAAINASNILEKIFDAYTDIRKKARGNASTVLMSYKHLGSIMKLIETQKGSFKTTANATKASLFGWTEIEVTTVKGTLTLVGIQEMANEEIMFVDWSALKFYSNGFFQKRKSPEGKEFYEVRATTGFSYLVDISLFGDLVLIAPSRCGIIYSVADY